MRNTVLRTGLLAGAVAIAGAGVAVAHHSYAIFDKTKEVTVTGVVETVEWTNPHVWVFVMAPGPDGKQARWAIEGDGPGGMTRVGWKKTSAKPGDKITVVVNPMVTDQIGGHYISAVLPGNVVIKRGEANVAVKSEAEKY